MSVICIIVFCLAISSKCYSNNTVYNIKPLVPTWRKEHSKMTVNSHVVYYNIDKCEQIKF